MFEQSCNSCDRIAPEAADNEAGYCRECLAGAVAQVTLPSYIPQSARCIICGGDEHPHNDEACRAEYEA
jgi:hypothetical protein